MMIFKKRRKSLNDMNKKYLKLGCIVRVPHQPWQCKTSLDLTNSGKFQSLDSHFVEFASIEYSAF